MLGSGAFRFESFCWVGDCNSNWPAFLDYLPSGQLAVTLMTQERRKIVGEGKLNSLFQDLCHGTRKLKKMLFHHQLSAIKYNLKFFYKFKYDTHIRCTTVRLSGWVAIPPNKLSCKKYLFIPKLLSIFKIGSHWINNLPCQSSSVTPFHLFLAHSPISESLQSLYKITIQHKNIYIFKQLYIIKEIHKFMLQSYQHQWLHFIILFHPLNV